MEGLVNPSPATWAGRSVFLTGHTGFKGGWLALWLKQLGAQVHGYAFDPDTDPHLFGAAGVGTALASDTRADLMDLEALQRALAEAKPDVVLHLAAQPLVRRSYAEPILTFASNVMGTAHVLEAMRSVPSVRAAVLITTDKVYENREWPYPYREVDPLGGHDPYSASKAAAEIVAASYRASFFTAQDKARIATARAGNVIGGGDWSADRLLPDCLNAFARNEPVQLRYPGAVRPWQHVLEPLAGYLILAERLLSADGNRFAGAWNFGPDAGGDAPVGRVAQTAAALWGEGAQVELAPSGANPHEAGALRLDSTRARLDLGWRPRWSLEAGIGHTVSWYKAWQAGQDMGEATLRQLRQYEAGA